jgi:hypothetical protein
MNGMSEDLFEPNRELTRAMMVQILYNIEGRPGAGSQPFPDVSAGAWYADAVAWAAASGIVYGFQDGSFGPKKPITREQMITILYRYTGDYNGCDVSGTGDLSAFSDADRIGSYALDSMSWAVGSGYIQGMGDGILAPKGTATRAQVAQLFMNYLDTGTATPSDLEDPEDAGESEEEETGEEPGYQSEMEEESEYQGELGEDSADGTEEAVIEPAAAAVEVTAEEAAAAAAEVTAEETAGEEFVIESWEETEDHREPAPEEPEES